MENRCGNQEENLSNFTAERLCFITRGKGEESGNWLIDLDIPGEACFEERIEGDEELTHAGDLDDEIGLTGGFESFGKGDEDGVTTLRGEGCHVECGADICASTGDAASAFEFTAVMVVGSESGECRDLGSRGGAEFGDFSEELVRGVLTDAGNAAEDLAFGFPVVVGFEELGDGLLDQDDLFVEEGDGVTDGLARQFTECQLLAVCFHGSELDELTTTRDEIL